MAVVIVPFPFAGNGFTVEYLVAGDERDFGSATAGLVEAGLISEEVKVAAVVGAIANAANGEPTPSASAQKRPHQRRR